MPALDGLRAFAVAAVWAYHLQYGWAQGGYLGVDLFFVLSGFLITGLLLGEWERTGGVRFRGFWGRRARRLLPAVLALLVVLALYSYFGGPGVDRPTLRGDSLATLFYFANWHFIFGHVSYFAQFAAPSPLKHTWSLAIEEQFYLVWPLLLVGLLGVARHAVKGGARRRALIVTIVLAAISAALMGLLYNSTDPSRVYFGTDTRAFELLVGAALAIFLSGRPVPSPRAQRLVNTIALVCAGVLVYSWTAVGGPPAWMYRGGMFAGAVLVAVVIAGVTQPNPGPLGAFLSLRPIRWVGKISYGLYLWHWPVIVLMTDTTTGLTGIPLLVARVAATLTVTTASYYLLERPIRRTRFSGWRTWVVAPTGVGVTAAAVLVATVPVTSTAAAAAAPTAQAAGAARASEQASASSLPSSYPYSVTPASDPSVVLPPGRVISRSNPLRILIIGDSVMYDAEPGVAAALEATGEVKIDSLAFPGWGLTLGNESWRTDWPRDIQSFRPDLVMGMWSWDDEAALADPTSYAALVNQALQILFAKGSTVSAVAFLQFPKSGEDSSNPNPAARVQTAIHNEKGREAWNAVMSGMVPLWPGRVMFLPTASSLELDGYFATWLPGPGGTWVRARKVDGEHLCPSGAARFGQAVLSELTPVYHLPPPSGRWWAGSWTKDTSRYNSLNCPDDKPPSGYEATLASGDPSTMPGS